MSLVMCHMSCVLCHLSCVTCRLSHVKIFVLKFFILFFLSIKKVDKVVELVGGGSVINGAYPSSLDWNGFEIALIALLITFLSPVYYTVLYFITLYSTAQHCMTLHYTVLYYTSQHMWQVCGLVSPSRPFETPYDCRTWIWDKVFNTQDVSSGPDLNYPVCASLWKMWLHPCKLFPWEQTHYQQPQTSHTLSPVPEDED